MITNNIRISAIAAMDSNTRAIGKKEGGFPWKRIQEDLAHFKKTTIGHPIIMGRVTWEEFGSKPLPNRPHIVLTRKSSNIPRVTPEGVRFARDIDEALFIASNIERASENEEKEIFIIGGAQIYLAGLEFCSRLYLTHIDTKAKESTGIEFPDYMSRGWRNIVSLRTSQNENYTYRFEIVEKINW